jgi:hypothetical protein
MPNSMARAALAPITGIYDILELAGGCMDCGPAGPSHTDVLRPFDYDAGTRTESIALEEGLATLWGVGVGAATAGNAFSPRSTISLDSELAWGFGTRAARAADDLAYVAQPSTALQHYWPPNRGFVESARATLLPGTRVDRYGSEFGTFVAPEGVPFGMRGLPAEAATRPYSVYEVLRPIEVDAGLAVPWHGQPGFGMQYELPSEVRRLVQQGYLRRVGP